MKYIHVKEEKKRGGGGSKQEGYGTSDKYCSCHRIVNTRNYCLHHVVISSPNIFKERLLAVGETIIPSPPLSPHPPSSVS